MWQTLMDPKATDNISLRRVHTPRGQEVGRWRACLEAGGGRPSALFSGFFGREGAPSQRSQDRGAPSQ